MPTPPPWWIDTHVAPDAVLSERVEQRPVGDGVGAVGHRLGLAVRRRDRAGVEVVATDHDRRRQLPAAHHLVEAQPEAMRARRSRASRCAPAAPGTPTRSPASRIQRARPSSSGNSSSTARSVGGDVGRVARQGDPSERALALAEQRADVGGQEAGVGEGAVEAAELGLGAQAVAVVEDLGATVEEADHRRAVHRHRLASAAHQSCRGRCAPSAPPPPA